MKKRFISIALAALMCFALCLGGCADGNRTANDGVKKLTYNGTHILTAPNMAGKWFVKDGATDYVVVMPKNASNFLKTAKDEFVALFKAATGIAIKVKTDDEVVAGQKFVSIGETAQFKANSAINGSSSYDKKKLGTYGVRIITNNDNIYLLSGKDHGLCQSVYSFMRIYFNFDEFYRNCYDIDKNVKNAALKNFNVTDIPDLPILIADNRYYNYLDPIGTDTVAGMSEQDIRNQRARMGYSDRAQEHLLPLIGDEPGHSGYYHNSRHYLDTDWSKPENAPADYVKFDNWILGLEEDPFNGNYPEGYDPEHPGAWLNSQWIASTGQLCYNAKGNKVAYEALIKQCAAAVEASLKARPREQYPNLNIICFTQMDGWAPCTCDACLANNEADGAINSGSQIRIINRIRREVGKWMEKSENEAYRRDDLVIMFFAYGPTSQAPASIDKNGKISLNNSECKMDDGVGVYYAGNEDFNFSQNIYEEINDYGRENLLKWAALTDNFWLWTYGSFHQQTIYFCDALSFFDNDYFNLIAACGADALFDEAQDYGDGATGWANLKNYIQCKLAWDCNADVAAFKDKFFSRMYGPAAEEMKEVYTAQRLYTATMLESFGYNELGVCYNAANLINSAECYPLNVLQSWLGIYDRALEKIEPYKALDENLYTVYKMRIECEAMSPLYSIHQLYGDDSSLDKTLYESYKQRMSEVLTWYPEFKSGADNDSTMLGTF